MRKFSLLSYFCALLAFVACIGSVAQADETATVQVVASPDASYPVSTTFKIRLTAKVTNEPTSTSECTNGTPRTWSGQHWTWTGPSTDSIVTASGQTSTDSPTVDLQVSFGATGSKSFNVNAKVSYTSSCGGQVSGSLDKTISGFQVVGIGQLQWKRNGTYVPSSGSFPDITDLLEGSTLRFKAVADPPGATWPSGYPKWSGSATSGTGETKDGTFSPPAGAGTRTVTVNCGNSVTGNIAVVLNPTFDPKTATVTQITPTTYRNSWPSSTTYGYTDTEYSSTGDPLTVGVSAYRDGSNWHLIMTSLAGYYSIRTRMQTLQEVTGIGGNTTAANSCDQVSGLYATSAAAAASGNWYMLSAILAHEQVHAAHFPAALRNQASAIEGKIEGSTLIVPDTGQTKQDAINAMKALPAWKTVLDQSFSLYDTQVDVEIANDHGPGGTLVWEGAGMGPAYQAEHNVTQPVIDAICAWRKAQKPPLTGCATCGD